MTKKEIAQAEAVKTLKEWGIVNGMTIFAKVVRVSASGMSRNVRLYVIDESNGDHKPSIVDISYWSAKALEWRYKGDGYNEGIIVSGCGMDMLLHTVDSLSYAMGYGALNLSHDSVNNNGLRYKQL